MLEVEDFKGYLEQFRGTQGLMQGLDEVAAPRPSSATRGSWSCSSSTWDTRIR